MNTPLDASPTSASTSEPTSAPTSAPTPEPLAPPAAQAPALWNPNAAAGWSLLFSPIFGAILHMKNWEAMGETTKAFDARLWAIGMAAALGGVVLADVVLPPSRLLDALGHAVGLPLLVVWYYASAKPQATRVAALYGRQYPRRGWLGPLLIGLAAIVGLIIAFGLLGAVMSLLISQH